MQKRPMLIIITIAAKVIDRSRNFCKSGGHKGLHLQAGVDRTDDPIFTNEVFHAIHLIHSLKLKG